MPDGNFAAPPKLGKYFEAFGLSDVFQVNSPKDGWRSSHSTDDFLGIFCIKANWERINAAEIFKKNAFPSITGKPASGPISPSTSTRAVRDNGDHVPFIRMLVNLLRIFKNILADFSDSRRIPDCKIIKSRMQHFGEVSSFPVKNGCIFIAS